ncbi:MAG: SLC13 family permease [Deltaproteobacteria bacterium]
MKKNLVIVLSGLVSFAIYFLLPVEKEILKGLSILFFIAALWLTEAVPLTVTALLTPILAVLTGILDVKGALSHFANPVIFLFMGGFALAAALHKHGLDELIAGRIMKAAGKKSLYSILGLFLSTALLSMWISNTATAAIMLPVALGIISNFKDPSPSRDAFILLGVAYSANIGGIGTIVGSPPNAITAANLGLSFRDWIAVGAPIVAILMPIMIAVLYYVLKPALPERNIQPSGNINAPKTRDMYKVGLIFLVIVTLWLFSRPISKMLGIEGDFDSIVALFGIFLLVFFRTIKWNEIQRFTDWGVLILFGGGLVLSAVLSETGASGYLAGLVETHMSVYGPFPLILGSVLLMIFLTEVASNTASAAIMVPIFLALGQETIHSSPRTIALSVGIAASCAFMLPVATPPNALVYGTEKVRQRTMIKTGLYLNIIFAVVISVVGYIFLK